MNTEIPLPAAELKAALPGLNKIVGRKSSLPILQNVKVSRERNGQVTLQATDLEAHATYTVAASQSGPPVEVLLPLEQLNNAFKCCGSKHDVVLISNGDETKLRYYIAGNPVTQPVAAMPLTEWPPVPQIKAESFKLDATFGPALRQALESCGDDPCRHVLCGACLDVSDHALHYIVGSDGHSLFAANSFSFPLKQSVIIPNSKFLGGSDLLEQEPCFLSVQPAGKGRNRVNNICLRTERWQFITKEVEGQFPAWKQNIPTPTAKWTQVKLSPSAISQVLQVVPRLPGDDDKNHPVRLRIEKGLWVEGRNQDDKDWTKVAISEVTITGKPQTIQLNRNYLLQALKFGLDEFAVDNENTPLVFSQAGRRFVVMPVCEKPAGQPAKPVASNPTAKPTEAQPSPTSNTPAPTSATERITDMAQTTTKTAAKPAEQLSLIDQVETIKDALKNVIRDLTALVDAVKRAEKDNRASEKEVEAARATLKKLQQVSL